MKNDEQTPVAFIDLLCQALKERDGVDVGLADIVSTHILAPNISEDCVDQAMTAIDALAVKRATHAKESLDA